METSILTSVKKTLNVVEADTTFDVDILMHVNSVLATLNQIGGGPENGFQIEDKVATWDDLLGSSDPRTNFVKSWVYLKVRLLFDPPATSFAIQAIQDQARELEFRIYTLAEAEQWL